MATTWARVSLLAPELAAIPALTQAEILAHVAATLSEEALGAKYDHAALYLCAHLGTVVLRGASGSPGAITSESVAGVSRSYGVSTIADTPLDSTTWGKEYRRLTRITCGGGMVL
jgi:hypothetical protein